MIKECWSTTRKMVVMVALGAVAVASAAWADHHEAGEAEAVRKFTVVNVLYEDSWPDMRKYIEGRGVRKFGIKLFVFSRPWE